MDKLSVIIPAYNASEFIERAVTSVVNQNYSPIEIIVVDDGSTDDTAVKVERLAEYNDNIVLMRIENGGPSRARFAGVERATGSYVQFLDSDDWLIPDSLGKMMRMVTGHNLDILELSFILQYEDGRRDISRNPNHGVVSGKEALAITMNGGNWAMWSRLVRKSLFSIVSDFAYDMIFGEDLIISAQLLANSSRVGVMYDPVIVYEQRQSSLVNAKGLSDRRRVDQQRYIKWMEDYIKPDLDREAFLKSWWAFKKYALIQKFSEGWTDDIAEECEEFARQTIEYPELLNGLPSAYRKLFKSFSKSQILGKIRLKRYLRDNRL